MANKINPLSNNENKKVDINDLVSKKKSKVVGNSGHQDRKQPKTKRGGRSSKMRKILSCVVVAIVVIVVVVVAIALVQRVQVERLRSAVRTTCESSKHHIYEYIKDMSDSDIRELAILSGMLGTGIADIYEEESDNTEGDYISPLSYEHPGDVFYLFATKDIGYLCSSRLEDNFMTYITDNNISIYSLTTSERNHLSEEGREAFKEVFKLTFKDDYEDFKGTLDKINKNVELQMRNFKPFTTR